MSDDTVNLKCESLSEQAEHAVIGLLLKDARFARNVLTAAVPHDLNHLQLSQIFDLIKNWYSKKKKPPTESNVRFLLEHAYQDDPARLKALTNLLNLCLLDENLKDPDNIEAFASEVYQKMQEVKRSKGGMKAVYDMALAYDPAHNPNVKKGGPAFEQQMIKMADAIKESLRGYNEGTPSPEERLALLEKKEAAREEAVKRRVPLISPDITKFMIMPGITLIGGVTKSGKSTVMANMIPAILDARPDKKVLVITCEDDVDMVLSRVACAILSVPIREFLFDKDRLPAAQVAEVKALKRKLTERIVVVSEGTTNLENVQSVLVEAKLDDYAAIFLDYYQVVNSSTYKRQIGYVEILKEFGTWLKAYAQDLQTPLVIFAQLQPMQEGEDIPFQSRMQYDKTVANHAHVSLEIRKAKPNDGQIGYFTEIICHLSRHSDPLGEIGRFQFVGGTLKYVKESSTLASNLVESIPESKG